MLTRDDKGWAIMQRVPLPGTLWAAQAPGASAIVRYCEDGSVVLHPDADARTVPLNNERCPCAEGYPVPHSGDGQCIVEVNGRVSVVWMGRDASGGGWGTPIWAAEYHRKSETVTAYPLHLAGFKAVPGQANSADIHSAPQLVVRPTDQHVVYVSGAHSGTLYMGVSHSPQGVHAGFGRFVPISPVTRYPSHGCTYPLIWMDGDALHVVARLYDGDWWLVRWSVDTKTGGSTPHEVIDSAPKGSAYAIWYQQREGDKVTYQQHVRAKHDGKLETAGERKAMEIKQ